MTSVSKQLILICDCRSGSGVRDVWGHVGAKGTWVVISPTRRENRDDIEDHTITGKVDGHCAKR